MPLANSSILDYYCASMKKLITLIVLLILFTPSSVYAAEDSAPTVVQVSLVDSEQAIQASPAATTTSIPEYFLPYPGLLPDSPLYFLKVARDRVVGFLIHDPLKKAEFNLLQADKRVQAGLNLVQKNKTKEQLAYTTVLKGENYFEDAIVKVREAKSQGIVTNDLSTKLMQANKKHIEIIQEMKKMAPEAEKKKYDTLLTHVTQLAEQVAKNLLNK
ncbi:hypothetical protein BH11PAT1_BH11PAT1_4970 [soil metagenome]